MPTEIEVNGRPVPHDGEAWTVLGQAYFDEYVAAVTAAGYPPDPSLRVEPDPSPCPAYTHDRGVILFGPPGLQTVHDHFFWCYQASLMGCPGPEAAIEGAALMLPLVMAHEVNHHLRHRYGRFTDDHFVEEQAVQLVAAAWFENHPDYGAATPALRAFCTRALRHLRQVAPLPPEYEQAYHLDPAEILADRQVISWRRLHAAEHIATVHHLVVEDVLAQHGWVTDEQLREVATSREEARRHFDATYMQNLAEYWHTGFYWLATYLRHERHPDFQHAAYSELGPGG